MTDLKRCATAVNMEPRMAHYNSDGTGYSYLDN